MEKTIEQRANDFKEKLAPFLKDFGRDTLNDFFYYWTEHNEGGRKMRFEMQKVFNVKRRLATWKRNESRYNFKPNATGINQKQQHSISLAQSTIDHYADVLKQNGGG
jgi:hypothetical protein